MIVRKAKIKEFDKILPLVIQGAKDFHKSLEDPNPISEKSISIYLSEIIKYFPCFVLEENNKIVGCAPLMAEQNVYTEQYIMTLFMIYILPKNRKNGGFTALLDAIVDFCVENKLQFMDTFTSRRNPAALSRVVEKSGLKCNGILVRL